MPPTCVVLPIEPIESPGLLVLITAISMRLLRWRRSCEGPWMTGRPGRAGPRCSSRAGAIVASVARPVCFCGSVPSDPVASRPSRGTRLKPSRFCFVRACPLIHGVRCRKTDRDESISRLGALTVPVGFSNEQQ